MHTQCSKGCNIRWTDIYQTMTHMIFLHNSYYCHSPYWLSNNWISWENIALSQMAMSQIIGLYITFSHCFKTNGGLPYRFILLLFYKFIVLKLVAILIFSNAFTALLMAEMGLCRIKSILYIILMFNSCGQIINQYIFFSVSSMECTKMSAILDFDMHIMCIS